LTRMEEHYWTFNREEGEEGVRQKILKMVEDHEDAPKPECGKCFAELKDDAKYRLRWKLKTEKMRKI
jgi:hypothetical protein